MAEDEEGADDRLERLGRLWWLTDTPLFIDTPLTIRLHDAVLAPELENEVIEKTRQEKVLNVLEGKGELKGSGKLSAPGFLEALFPSVNAEARAEIAGKREALKDKIDTIKGRRVRTTERLLQEIVFAYLADYPERILFVDMEDGGYSNMAGPVTPEDVTALLKSPPRPLVFVDLPKKSVIFPTVAELETCGFRKIFEELERDFLRDADNAYYPSDSDPDAEAKRKKYWDALKEHFKSRRAMEVLEEAMEHDRVGWIDFRLLFNKANGDTAHLHVVPAGQYHAGVFGYNFVHRGYRHGARVVGTLKAGNDVNVLAIYEV